MLLCKDVSHWLCANLESALKVQSSFWTTFLQTCAKARVSSPCWTPPPHHTASSVRAPWPTTSPRSSVVVQWAKAGIVLVRRVPGTAPVSTRSSEVFWGTLQWCHISAMASQITGVLIVYSTVCSGADQRKHQSSASLAFVRGIHRWTVNSPHAGPVTR